MKALVLSILVAVGLWLSYQAGQTEAELACQTTLKEINETSEANRKADEVKINVIETKRVTQKVGADKRSRLLAERLRKAKPRVSDTPDKPACRITPDAYVVLREAASDPRIQPASDPPIPVSATDQAPNAGAVLNVIALLICLWWLASKKH